MGGHAECMMLNKVPHIVKILAFLSGVHARMDTCLYKRKALLRKLSIVNIS